MPDADRARVAFHGAVVLLVGLLCGYPSVLEPDGERLWHTAHESMILMGTLMFALSSALPALALPPRERAGLVWSLLAMGYGFMASLLIQGLTGVRTISPSASPLVLVGFLGNAVGVLASLLVAGLTLTGARAARRAAARGVPAAGASLGG